MKFTGTWHLNETYCHFFDDLQEGMSQQNLTRVRRFQRELEAAEDRAECAETNLNFVRAKHRSFVTAVPGGQATSNVYVVEERRGYSDEY